MFWHESKENDNNLINYSKTDYLKMVNPKSKRKNSFEIIKLEKGEDKNILDLSDNFREDMIIQSDWGPGKVISVDKAAKKVVLKIEGTEKEFDMFELHPFLLIYIQVFFKDLNLQDKRVIINENLALDDTIGKLKKKIADIFKSDKEKVILVHKGEKMTNNNKKVSELGLFSQGDLIAVVNGICDY